MFLRPPAHPQIPTIGVTLSTVEPHFDYRKSLIVNALQGIIAYGDYDFSPPALPQIPTIDVQMIAVATHFDYHN